jgi:hypothetical protein
MPNWRVMLAAVLIPTGLAGLWFGIVGLAMVQLSDVPTLMATSLVFCALAAVLAVAGGFVFLLGIATIIRQLEPVVKALLD